MVFIPVTIITAAAGRAKVEDRLRAAGAITPERAIDLTPEGDDELSGLDEAIGLGRIVRSANGRLFLNPAAVANTSGEGVFALLLFLLVAASVVVSVVVLVAAFKD